ncbi:phage holin family protein [Erythrobacter litoralis]|uniref:phage holin family protein n=1 Tax=Erythrobacter litoralis TaxID=39960 RepID=UPI00243548B8|nr:phage holin family protein [Erythrobacter litoralis]
MDRTETETSYRSTDIPEPEFDPADANDQATSSLTDDVASLYSDGKTYAQAELAYQKTRARFVSDRVKGAAVFAVGALGAIHLALIAFTVGLVLALATLVGFWIATLLVVLLYVVGAIVLVLKLKAKVEDIREAMAEKSDG